VSEKFLDPVVAEVHATRAAMLEAAGGSIAELMQQVADRQRRSQRQIILEPLPNRPELTDVREAGLRVDSHGQLRVPPA
jgi:hypothetical protein